MRKILISAITLFLTLAEMVGTAAGAAAERQTEETRYAVTTLAVNFLREAPDYASGLETQALMGRVVAIVGEQGYWRQVLTDEPYKAWCTALGLAEMSLSEIEEYMDAPKYICTAWRSAVYAEPSDRSLRICELVEGDLLRRFRVKPGMTGGGVRRGYAEVLLPDGRTGYVRKKDLEDWGEWRENLERMAQRPDYKKDIRKSIIASAMKFIGTPYLWGGASPNGVDCSGLVRHVFMMNGIRLPRNASQQAQEGEETSIRKDDGSTDFSGLLPGDLLFFGTAAGEGGRERIGHVAIYMGEGRIIHASQLVRINSLLPGEPDYYENSHKLLKARRLISGKKD